MDNDQNIQPVIQPDEKRQREVSAGQDDILVKVLGIPQVDYQCVTVNSSWFDKGLIEGDIVLFKQADAGGARDIVLIDEDGQVRMGLMAYPGYLETFSGTRPLEAQEKIIGVGIALARKLGGE
jgi:hypothetical protein